METTLLALCNLDWAYAISEILRKRPPFLPFSGLQSLETLWERLEEEKKKSPCCTHLLFFQQLEYVVAISYDSHLLFQHRFQHGEPITYLWMESQKRQRRK